jgi:hypothetical protein
MRIQVHDGGDRAAAASTGADLLLRRLSALGLSPSALAQTELKILQDLQRRCACCEHHDRCTIDLFRQAVDCSWVNYCPNSVMLNALTEAWYLRELLGRAGPHYCRRIAADPNRVFQDRIEGLQHKRFDQRLHFPGAAFDHAGAFKFQMDTCRACPEARWCRRA